jgi:hypothetical protein
MKEVSTVRLEKRRSLPKVRLEMKEELTVS